MRPIRGVRAVGVVIPARDEQDRVVECLRSVRRSLHALPPSVDTAVTIVLDRCTDRTPELVLAELAGWPGATAVRVAAVGGTRAGSAREPEPAHIVAGSGVGAVRDLGVRLTMRRLRGYRPRQVWLLHTDADSQVPADWATAHLRCAAAGACGVAGTVDLRSTARLSAAALDRYQRIVDAGLTGAEHSHVYGANLGVRADAYLAVGGFPPDDPGEDHGLWSRLRAAGYPLAAPAAIQVTTSARTHGRAHGGLADLLRTLQDTTDPATLDEEPPLPEASDGDGGR